MLVLVVVPCTCGKNVIKMVPWYLVCIMHATIYDTTKIHHFLFFFLLFFFVVTSSTRDEVDFDKTAHKKKYSILVSSIPPHK